MSPNSDVGHVASAFHAERSTNGAGPRSWQSVDWRSHQRWVTLSGRPTNLIDLGQGPAILFIHGLSGCWANWLEQMAVFADSHRVLAIDLPGFGHSPGDAGDTSMPGYARLCDELLAQLGIDSAVIVGNSMGGLIGAELAAAYPQRVKQLVLISPAGISTYANRLVGRGLPLMRSFQRVIALGAAWTAANSDTITRRPRMRELALKGVIAHPNRLSGALAAEQVRGAGTDGFLGALESIFEYDLSERLPLISCPTLVVWGQKDRLISVRDADRFATLIPGARKVLYPDTGHMSMLERPEEFNSLLADFIAQP